MNTIKTIISINKIKYLLLGFAILLILNNSYGQARWQADVSIISVNITPASIKKVPKPTDNINKPTEKIVQPVEVSVVSMPSNATLDPSVNATQPFAGYITFNLGHMAVQQNITVEFTFTKSKYGNKVGAYAYSLSPDPNPANNYKEASY